MKTHIENLVKLNISETETLTIVRNIAIYAFEKGKSNIIAYEMHNEIPRDISFDH